LGGITTQTTSCRTGCITAAERRSLFEAGAMGDVLYGVIDACGALVDHEVNKGVISAILDDLRRTPEPLLVSGGRDKRITLHAAIHAVRPTTLITAEVMASGLLTWVAALLGRRAFEGP
jgi:deoxyribonucleoside regulator